MAGIRGPERDVRLKVHTSAEPVQPITDEVLRDAALTVCDPARGLSKEEAREILTAIGLVDDPDHTERGT